MSVSMQKLQKGKAAKLGNSLVKPEVPKMGKKIVTPLDAAMLQAIYLMLFEKYQKKTQPIMRKMLVNQRRIKLNGRDFEYSAFRGTVVDVRYKTKTGIDERSGKEVIDGRVSAICVMYPEIQDHNTKSWFQFDSHVWLFPSMIFGISDTNREPKISVCIGDTLRFMAHVTSYSDGSGRKGFDRWAISSSSLIYTYGKRLYSVPRNIITKGHLVDIDRDDTTGDAVFALRSWVSKELDYLRNLPNDDVFVTVCESDVTHEWDW